MSSDIEQLAQWRTIGARHSEEVFELAQKVLKTGRLGEDEWAIREQLIIAALDLGRIKLAKEQFATLAAKFPGSARADALIGLQLEAIGEIDKARELYAAVLKRDETNITAHQRLIAISLSNPTSAITNLLSYLDNFYSDAAAWSLLAELYADMGMYSQSMTALGHLMILQSWDSNAVCRTAETAYTMGDYPLALKYFLRAAEMEVNPARPTQVDGPARTRSWWGVKLALRQLMKGKKLVDSSVPPEQMTSPAQLKALDGLSTERLLAAGGVGMSVRRVVLSGTSEPKIR